MQVIHLVGSSQAVPTPFQPCSCAPLAQRGFGAERGTRAPTSFLSPADLKLSRFAGVSEAKAERESAGEIPKRSWRGISRFSWCREGDSNPHELFEPCGF